MRRQRRPLPYSTSFDLTLPVSAPPQHLTTDEVGVNVLTDTMRSIPSKRILVINNRIYTPTKDEQEIKYISGLEPCVKSDRKTDYGGTGTGGGL